MTPGLARSSAPDRGDPRGAGRTGLVSRLDTASAPLMAAYAALVAKLWIALVTAGTNDVGTYLRFGGFIRSHGLGAMYRADSYFGASHVALPPLPAFFSAAIASWSSFPFWIRLPGVLADLVTVKALIGANRRHQMLPWWALTAFACSPVSLLVSGYHGNLDSIMVMCCVLAVIAVLDDRPVICGAWIALALNVKVAAALILPLLVLLWWYRRRARSFVPAVVGLTLAGWLPALVVAPRQFIDQVVGYSSQWGSWGFTHIAQRLGGASLEAPTELEHMTSQESTIASILKVLIVLGTLFVAWRFRKAERGEVWTAMAVTWGIFFVLAPGIGAQYLVWIAPFILLASPRWYLVVTAACTVSLVAVYGITSHWGFEFSHFTDVGRDQWLPWMLIAWLGLAAWCVSEVRRGVIGRRNHPR